MIITALIILFCFLCYLSEEAERKSRRYYTDQWLMRSSGFWVGCALTLLVCSLAFN